MFSSIQNPFTPSIGLGDDALWQYVLTRNIKHIYVDVDKTILYKRKLDLNVSSEYVGLPEGIHSDYKFLSEQIDLKYKSSISAALQLASQKGEKLYLAKINSALIKQLNNVLHKARLYHFGGIQEINHELLTRKMPTINILSTGGWQKETFINYFRQQHLLHISQFQNRENVMENISGPRIGFVAKGRVKNIDWSKSCLLIDDQLHQRLGFSMYGYTLNPGQWW